MWQSRRILRPSVKRGGSVVRLLLNIVVSVRGLMELHYCTMYLLFCGIVVVLEVG